jgi:hypothetical protein
MHDKDFASGEGTGYFVLSMKDADAAPSGAT